MKKDPVKEMLGKYPRILVIKAALKILKDGNKIDRERIEKTIVKIMTKKRAEETQPFYDSIYQRNPSTEEDQS